MKGVESIVGAYLALVIIVGVMFAFYTWTKSSVETLNEQINALVDNIQHVTHPPVISIKSVNDTSMTVEIRVFLPMNITKVVMKTVNDIALFHSTINRYVFSHLEIGVPRPNENVSLYILTDRGLIFYYVPRLDPRLQLAPDHIRNKAYIDAELLDYLSATKTSSYGFNVMLLPLDHVDYKVSWGVTWGDRYQDALLKIPVNCRYVEIGSYCNVNIDLASNVLTFKLPIGSVDYNGDYLRVRNFNYTQVYRVIRYKGQGRISLNMSVSLRGTNTYAVTYLSPVPVIFVPVVYVFDTSYNPMYPVAVYQPVPIWYGGTYILPQPWMNIWFDRILLNNATIYWNSLNYWNNTYHVLLDTSKYPFNEGYVIIGIEAVILTFPASYHMLEVKIEIKPVG